MSESVNYRWTLEAQRRREAYLERISSNVARFRDSYRRKLNELAKQGLEAFAQTEFAEVRRDLDRLDMLVTSDPESARDLSFQVGESLSGLPGLARSIQRDFQERDRQCRAEIKEARREATSELASFLSDLLGYVSDPVVRDFAYDKLREIQRVHQGVVVDASELDSIKSKIQSQFDSVLASANEQASQWKATKSAELAGESSSEMINLCREAAQNSYQQNSETLNKMLAGLDSLSASLNNAESFDNVLRKVQEIAGSAEESAIDEDCRRMVVRSIMESLQKTGFVVTNPKRSTEGLDEVVIRARKPSGPEALFRVHADGNMIYKFENYEGMRCKTDIDQVLPLLQEIYGIDLSDERVLWQNPDKLSREARPIDNGNSEKRNG